MLILLIGCKEEVIIPSEVNYFNAMDTSFKITIFKNENSEDIDQFDELLRELLKDIDDTLKSVHKLTDNFNAYSNLNNIYYINENPNQKIEIDKELFEIIKLAEEFRVEFEGYFDISIGLIVDEWKKLINGDEEIFEKDEDGKPIPLTDEEFNSFLDNVLSIPVIENGINLTEENSKYYIQIKEGVKIDLGAIAKGYVVSRIKDMIKDKGISEYKVEGSESSLEFGENPNRENNIFRVGIRSTKPLEYTDIVEVKNQAIATSGDTVQYYLHNDIKYHHIISPITKKPEQHRALTTIIGTDSTKLDAMTTALMSMDDDKFLEFSLKYPELIFYNIK